MSQDKKVLLISYELNAVPKERYSELLEAIKKADIWWHYIENTWLISTSLDPKSWYEKLCSKIYKNDRLLIIEVKPDYFGWLPEEAWEWIQKNLG